MDEAQIVQEQINVAKQAQDTEYLKHAPVKEEDSVLSKHLQPTEQIEHVDKLLMG